MRLRLMTEADIDIVHSYQSREDVCRYLLFDPRDRDTVAAKVAEHIRHTRLESDGDYLQLAVERKDDGQMIGDLYITVKSVENDTAELGWTFHPDHHGQGYATESAKALLALAFDTVEFHRVIAELDPRNDASVNLCLRLGMRREAHFVEDLWFKGEWADTGSYAMLAREYRAS
nr:MULTISPECIES: GNAT family protein [unclassified Cryobacterium]